MPSNALRATLLTENLPYDSLGRPSRPSSPWSSLSSILQNGVLGNSNHARTTSYASRIPVLAESPARYYHRDHFYSEIGEEEDMLEQAGLRFSDPPPTLKELHSDGHKLNEGISGDDDGLGDNAEVWNEYVAEAEEYDTELITELNGSLDVLLIFAGLFCAVLAALIIESYKMLLPSQDDSLEMLKAILSTLQNSSQPYEPSGTDFQPTSSAVRVNALWFGSLSLALGVAVQVMLAKQWLHKYGEGLSNVPRLRSQLRQYRYDSLRGWSLPEMVNFLPTLLHLALALFLLGLIDFLWNIHKFVAGVTLTICVIFASMYTLVMVLPHFYTDCPYKTPFSRLIGLAFHRARVAIHNFRQDMGSPPKNIPLEQAEYQAIQARRDVLQAKALAWLMTNSRNPLVVKTLSQSLASLTPSFTAIPILRQAGAIQRVAEQFLSCFTEKRMLSETNEIMVQFQLNQEKSVEAGLYAKALVGLTEGLPASRWPQRPPRDLNLYANVLDAAFNSLSAQSEDPEIIAFAVAAREHIFRAGRTRYPNSRSQSPTHSLGGLLELITKIADDELIPGVGGVVCAINTVGRCVEAAALEQRFSMWTEFAPPLMRILADTPPNCRVRDSLSRTFACFSGINQNKDYSDGQDPTEHRLIITLSTLLAAGARRSRGPEEDDELSEVVADALRGILSHYSTSFVHSIRPLGYALSILLPILFVSHSSTVKRCCLEMVQHADYADLPPDAFSELMKLLKDTTQSEIHPELARVLERHLHRVEVQPLLSDEETLKGILHLLTSADEEVQIHASGLLLDICAMGIKAGGKGAQRSSLEPLINAGLLSTLKDFFWHCSAVVSSDSSAPLASSQQDGWVPRLLSILELYPDEVLESGIMDACIMLCQEVSLRSGQGGTDKNLKEWYGRYKSWIESGKRKPRPRPKGPLHRRLEIS